MTRKETLDSFSFPHPPRVRVVYSISPPSAYNWPGKAGIKMTHPLSYDPSHRIKDGREIHVKESGMMLHQVRKEGKSIRSISREREFSQVTVRHYLRAQKMPDVFGRIEIQHSGS